MPPRFVRQAVANNMAQSLVLIVLLGTYLGVRLANARSEYAHYVNKNTLNKFSFRAQLKNFVILSMQSEATCSQGLRSACIHVATPLKKAKP